MRMKLVGATVVIAALFCAAAAAPSYHDDQVQWDKERLKRYAYLLGYYTGYSEGGNYRGTRISYKDMPGYRDGINGYLVWMGSQSTYREYYRKGYEEGFKDSQNYRPRRYDQEDVERVLGDRLKNVYNNPHYDPYGGHRHGDNRPWWRPSYDRDQIYRIAYDNGYRDGYRHGREDRIREVGYDYDHSSQYRDALRGYRSEYGDRDFYRRAYRDGYRRGYDDGYRNSDYRRRGWWNF